MIQRKLQLLQADYDLVKKYDNISSENVVLAPKVEKKDSQECQIKDDSQEKKDDEEDENNEDDEFGEYQYECMDEDDKDEPKKESVNIKEVDPSSIEHKNPFDKPLDVDLIKNIMSKITLTGPDWAQNKDQWKTKLDNMFKENTEIKKQRQEE